MLDPAAVEPLEAVEEHGPVLLREDVVAYHDPVVVRPDGEEQGVEGRMVELAEGDAVLDPRLAQLLPVRHDVGRVEELRVAQAAEGALLSVRPEHPLPERALVKPPADQRGDVPAPGVRLALRDPAFLAGPEAEGQEPSARRPPPP